MHRRKTVKNMMGDTMEERYTNDAEIFDKIKEVIYKLHPVTKPRINSWEYLCNCTKKPEMAICFNFYIDNDNSTKTQVMFLDGTESAKQSTGDIYIVNSALSEETIGKVILFLLSEFPYINSLDQCGSGFEIIFNLGLENEEQEGISCSKIYVQFETHPILYKDFKQLFRNYLEFIVDSFYIEVSKTPQFMNAYKNYSDKIKREIIGSLSYEELHTFIKIIDEKNLRLLLSNIDNSYFFKLCDTYQKQNDTVKRRILELKDCATDDIIDN